MSPETRAHLLRFYDGRMLPDEMFAAMSGDPGWFSRATIARSARVRHFAPRPFDPGTLVIHDHGRQFDLYDYLSINRVTGLMVLKRGELAFECYQNGLTANTPWHSCSLAKSVASTLMGMAVQEGAIASLEQTIGDYLDMAGPYREVTLRQLLGMCSGVRWNEAYSDSRSDRRGLLDAQTRCEPGAIVAFMQTLDAHAPAGSAWTYSTGESYLVAAVMEQATGMSLAAYASERLWSRIGMQHDATWWTESPGGMTVSGSGLYATLGDYARFGQFALEGGRAGGQALLPADWFARAGAAQHIHGGTVPYGYMWWIPQHPAPELAGAFQAEGIYGQYIHVNPAHELVAVVLSARNKPTAAYRLEISDNAFFAALATAT